MHVPGTLRQRLWIAALPLSTAAGLAAYILSGVSLRLGIGVAALVGFGAAYTVWHRTPPPVRPLIRKRARAGFIAGCLGTIAYDASRFILVRVLHFSFSPFDVLPLFGRLLVGSAAPNVVLVIGWTYHFINGIGFGVAFVFLVRRINIIAGLVWAGVLELCMVSLYPSWLGLAALNEFISISILGHAIYGLVLGLAAQRLLRPLDWEHARC